MSDAHGQNRVAAEAGQKNKAPPDIRSVDDPRFRQILSDESLFEQDLLMSSGRRDTSGVIIKHAGHSASDIGTLNESATKSPLTFLNAVGSKQLGPILQSSVQDEVLEGLEPNANGFVRSAIYAYSFHHHLRIRPDDLWLAIITQFSAYVNAHAEELRGSFVAHEGRKELLLTYYGTRFSTDWGDFAQKIGIMIQDNVVDPELREWIKPAFSTTTPNDNVVASIVMMASMQTYFEYGGRFICGLPSVTLLGRKADWGLILTRLHKLRSYGSEPTAFANLLTPVIKRFVLSFEAPESEEVIDFWNHIFTKKSKGSGSETCSGWITAFMFWNKEGKMLYEPNPAPNAWLDQNLALFVMDGMTYHRLDTDDIPPGISTVPVKIDDNGVEIMSEMLAGSIGIDCTSSGVKMANGKIGLDTLQPRSGWWIYETTKE